MRARPAGPGGTQLKFRERAAILSEFAFALQHVNVDSRLILDAGSKQFLGAGRNRGIPWNNFRDHPAHGFDPQRQRRHIQQQ